LRALEDFTAEFHGRRKRGFGITDTPKQGRTLAREVPGFSDEANAPGAIGGNVNDDHFVKVGGRGNPSQHGSIKVARAFEVGDGDFDLTRMCGSAQRETSSDNLSGNCR
jgi:hypothetical protein